jgi:hypothetical protein
MGAKRRSEAHQTKICRVEPSQAGKFLLEIGG